MYARFLEEAAGLCSEPRLNEISICMHTAGDMWQAAAGLFEQAYEADDPEEILGDVNTLLSHVADEEQLAWLELEKLLS